MKLNTNNSCRALSYIEMIATVLVIGALSSVAVVEFASVRDSAKAERLKTNVASLNSAVKGYISSGGSLVGATSAQQVLNKLKTTAANGKKIAGFGGSFVDPRLEAVEQSDEEASQDGVLRVHWDASAKVFIIADRGPKGIRQFRKNPSAVPSTPATEQRSTTFELAENESGQGTWVWNYETAGSAVGSPIVTSAAGDPSPDIDPVATTTPGGQLYQPTVSPPPTTYALADYGNLGKEVVVSNPNTVGNSELMISINGSAWSVVLSGETVRVPPGGSLSVYARMPESPADVAGDYYSSHVRSGLYEANVVNLTPPGMATTASTFHPLTETSIGVSLSHSNDPLHGKVVYKVGESDWQDYIEAFTLNIADHVRGTVILAKSVATQWPEHYLESSVVSTSLSTDTYVLQTPVVTTSAPSLHPLTSADVVVNVTNPNDVHGAISNLVVSLDDGNHWAAYSEQFILPIDDYSNGVTLLARAVPSIYEGALLKSGQASKPLQAVHVTLQQPIVAVSGATFHPFDQETITVDIVNPNEASVSVIEYSLDGVTWMPYKDSFTLDIDDYTNGVAVLAKAIPTKHESNIDESAPVSSSLNAVSVTLDPPVITASASMLDPFSDPMVMVNISNPNSAAVSKVEYSIDAGTTWLDLENPLNFGFWDYYLTGAVILAKAVPTVHLGNLFESIPVSETIEPYLIHPLEAPIVTNVPGGESVNLVTQGDHVPPGARIFYTTDGTDPGNDGAGSPLTGTLFTGDFDLPTAMCDDLVTTARVYAPVGYEVVFEPSPIGSLVKPSKASSNAGYQLVCDFIQTELCQYAWISLGDTHFTGAADQFIGNLALGPNTNFNINQSGAAPNIITMDPTATITGSGAASATPTVGDTSEAASAALALNQASADLTPTQSFGRIRNSTTISSTVPGGVNVINIQNIALTSTNATLTIQGGPDDHFILNVAKGMKLLGDNSLVISGVDPSQVLINVYPGADVVLGGTGTEVEATILAPGSDVTISGGGSVSGAVISGGSSTISGSGTINNTNAFGGCDCCGN